MSEKVPYKHNFLDRLMLRRIGSRVLWLPKDEPFDVSKGSTHVSGFRSKYGSVAIDLDEPYGGGTEDDRVQTSIRLDQGAGESTIPTALTAKRFICDDIAEQAGNIASPEAFILGTPVNSLSLYEVMRSVARATRIIADAKTIEYLMTHPEPTQVTEERFRRAL